MPASGGSPAGRHTRPATTARRPVRRVTGTRAHGSRGSQRGRGPLPAFPGGGGGQQRPAAVAAALGVLVRAGLARPAADGRVEFAHPLLRRPSTKRSVSRSARACTPSPCTPSSPPVDPARPRRTPSRPPGQRPPSGGVLGGCGAGGGPSGGLGSAVRSLASAVTLAGGKASSELLLLLAESQLGAGLYGSAEATCGAPSRTVSGPRPGPTHLSF